jgi:hypothetical protein
MALIAHTVHTDPYNTTTVTTSPIDTTGAEFIAVCVCGYNNIPSAVTDAYGNTWVALTTRVGGGGLGDEMYARIFYCINPTVGSGHTFSVNGTSMQLIVGVQAFDDLIASFDAESGFGSVAAASSVQPGSISPANDGELFITSVSTDSLSVPTIDSGFTISDTLASGQVAGFAYKKQTGSAAAENPTWTLAGGPRGIATAMAAFAIAPPPPTITSTSLPNGLLGTAYSATPTVSGGVGSITWSIISGSLPPGLSLNTSTGAITGTPTVAGSYSFTLRATDTTPSFDDQAFTLLINDFSPHGLFNQVRESPDAVSVWTVKVTFPAFGILPERILTWSTVADVELENGDMFSKALTDPPKMRHQRDRGNDYAEFSVADPGKIFYQSILPYEDLIETASVEIREAYEVVAGYFASEINFYGFLKDFQIDDTNNVLGFTVLSDMSRGGFFAGNRILTRERCGTAFNVNGVLAPEDSICGWQTSQGGNALFCSKLLLGVDGCAAHLNTHRFYAVTALSTSAVQIIGNEIPGSGGGWDYETGPCFGEKVFVVMGDGSIIPITKAKPGMNALGIDLFRNDALVYDNEIYQQLETPDQELWEAEFDDAVFQVKKNHLFYVGSRYFAPVGFLGESPALGMDLSGKPVISRLLSIEKLSGLFSVYNLWTATGNYVVTDENRTWFAVVHNDKPIEARMI